MWAVNNLEEYQNETIFVEVSSTHSLYSRHFTQMEIFRNAIAQGWLYEIFMPSTRAMVIPVHDGHTVYDTIVNLNV